MKQTDPIFIAEFENGHQTCTAVFCPPDKLDPARGLLLARKAFERLMGRPPPFPIVRARFEFNEVVLANYDRAAIAALDADPQAEWKARQRIP
jgi:hypothetical protein